MRLLDLFSGIGGFSLGLERAGMTTVAFCEIESYPRKVLAKHWPKVPCYHDIKDLTLERLSSDGIVVDVMSAGFPCQDISICGKGAGISGDRSSLWSEAFRLCREIRPKYFIAENSKFIRSRGLEVVLSDLSQIGYDAEWHCIPASSAGARHFRDRCWIVAHPSEVGPLGWWRGWPGSQEEYARLGSGELWQRRSEPLPMGVLNGVPDRVDRIGALGNAVVPDIPELIGLAILKKEATANAAY
jgi:DNA (cytosine-5)-methyltransferase 1